MATKINQYRVETLPFRKNGDVMPKQYAHNFNVPSKRKNLIGLRLKPFNAFLVNRLKELIEDHSCSSTDRVGYWSHKRNCWVLEEYFFDYTVEPILLELDVTVQDFRDEDCDEVLWEHTKYGSSSNRGN